MNYQKGVGLIEILVAVVLLAIAVLGFVALQIRAVSASIDAGNNTQATSLAKDLAERIRANRRGYDEFIKAETEVDSTSVTDYITTYTGGQSLVNCATDLCTPIQMAEFDFDQVDRKANILGMDIAINNCQGSTLRRKCIYVAWDDTTPTNGTTTKDCTNGTAYTSNAKCIIMEIYNYD